MHRTVVTFTSCSTRTDEAAEPAAGGRRAHRAHGLGARGRGVRRRALADLPRQVPRAQGHRRHALRRAAG